MKDLQLSFKEMQKSWMKSPNCVDKDRIMYRAMPEEGILEEKGLTRRAEPNEEAFFSQNAQRQEALVDIN